MAPKSRPKKPAAKKLATKSESDRLVKAAALAATQALTLVELRENTAALHRNVSKVIATIPPAPTWSLVDEPKEAELEKRNQLEHVAREWALSASYVVELASYPLVVQRLHALRDAAVAVMESIGVAIMEGAPAAVAAAAARYQTPKSSTGADGQVFPRPGAATAVTMTKDGPIHTRLTANDIAAALSTGDKHIDADTVTRYANSRRRSERKRRSG